MHTNVQSVMPLCGDAKVILSQLNEALGSTNFNSGKANTTEWTTAITTKSEKNAQVSLQLA